jgi:hypothetical protein
MSDAIPIPYAPLEAPPPLDTARPTLNEYFAIMTGEIYDGDPPHMRYYSMGTVSDRGISSVQICGLNMAREVYSLLLRDPKYNKFQKIRRPRRYRRTPNGINWGDSMDLDAIETGDFAQVEASCKDASAVDFDSQRTRLCLPL